MVATGCDTAQREQAVSKTMGRNEGVRGGGVSGGKGGT